MAPCVSRQSSLKLNQSNNELSTSYHHCPIELTSNNSRDCYCAIFELYYIYRTRYIEKRGAHEQSAVGVGEVVGDVDHVVAVFELEAEGERREEGGRGWLRALEAPQAVRARGRLLVAGREAACRW